MDSWFSSQRAKFVIQLLRFLYIYRLAAFGGALNLFFV